jgi:hypothetical protein
MYQTYSNLLWLPGIYEGWRYRINRVAALSRFWYVIHGVFKDDTYKQNRTIWKPDVPFDLYVRVDVPLRDLQVAVWRRSLTLG